MKKAFTIIAAASLLLTAACSKQEAVLQDNPGEGQTISLTLEATRGADDQATKTAITYNSEYASLESVWTAGDKIYVYSRKSGDQIGTLTQSGDIINQKASSTSQYPTSYATFSGSVTLGSGDALTDDYAFVYQGSGRSLTPTDGKLTYAMGTSDDVAGLNAWDLAYATGKIQGTAAEASCAVSFSNKVAFGYFTTAGFTQTLKAQYYSDFTFDVKNGTLTGVSGEFTLPSDAAFYMPLVPGAQVNLECEKTWSQKDTLGLSEAWGYGAVSQSKSFTPSAGYYYRLGRNATPSFGPVGFTEKWKLYETLKGSKFSVSDTSQVYFTQGNLQYIGSASTPYWRIAPDQYSYLGKANGKPSSTESGSYIADKSDIDLFGWGEVGKDSTGYTSLAFCGSTVNDNYQPNIKSANLNLSVDWATKFNGDSPTILYAEDGKEYPKTGGSYYFLTKAEWQNLFANQYWGFATVTLNDGTTVYGIVIYPNTVTTQPSGNWHKGATYTPTGGYTENRINQSTIDGNGLLFLPAAGYRDGLSLNNVGSHGRYWSSTSSSAAGAYYMYFRSISFSSANSSNRYYGCSVRLACKVN